MSPEKRAPVLLVLSAPTGGGKTTIAHRLLERDPHLRFSISHTTRSPRPGETEGRDYHFVDREAFLGMREAGGFLEWAEVHGNFYGTHRSEVERAEQEGRDLILDIDVQGGIQVREAWPKAVLVFILPPTLEELLRRLGSRSAETGFDLGRRLESAQRELALAPKYDYNVVNEDLERATDGVLSVLRAARMRPGGADQRCETLLQDIDTWLRGTRNVPGR